MPLEVYPDMKYSDEALRTQNFTRSKCNLTVSNFIGDEYGNPIETAYKVRSEWRTKTFGPWTWSLFGTSCVAAVCQEIAAMKGEYAINSCCSWIDFMEGKSKYDYVPQLNKEFMKLSQLSVDIGLFYKFETDINGRPTGCPGMDNQDWVNNYEKFSGKTSCPLNDAPAAVGMSMADVMKLYAGDNNVWVKDFMAVYQDMLENGVYQEDLVDSPRQWFGAMSSFNMTGI